ncbi:hypothetical protein QL285_041134 [Trifolium repens]|nr:hypothetical protein QL285_041134 [Trifolium repens]
MSNLLPSELQIFWNILLQDNHNSLFKHIITATLSGSPNRNDKQISPASSGSPNRNGKQISLTLSGSPNRNGKQISSTLSGSPNRNDTNSVRFPKQE